MVGDRDSMRRSGPLEDLLYRLSKKVTCSEADKRTRDNGSIIVGEVAVGLSISADTSEGLETWTGTAEVLPIRSMRSWFPNVVHLDQ